MAVGQPAFAQVHGTDFFAYFRQHPDEWRLFDAVMATRAVAAAYDFAQMRTVVDVGGGHGALAIGLLQAHPHLRAIVCDQLAVADLAAQTIAAAGLAERGAAVGCDFFAAVPSSR